MKGFKWSQMVTIDNTFVKHGKEARDELHACRKTIKLKFH
jgi:hypothetical protein